MIVYSRIQVVVYDHSTSENNSIEQDSGIWITLASRQSLDILEISCSFEPVSPHSSATILITDRTPNNSPKTNDTDRRSIRRRAINSRARHQNRFPLGRKPNSARFNSRKVEPILTFRISVEQIIQLDPERSERSIVGERVLVVNSYRDVSCGFLRDEELGGAFPDRRGSSFESLGTVDDLLVEEHGCVGVDLLAARIEIFRLVNDKTDDTGLCENKGSQSAVFNCFRWVE